jgi:hypothetical protein
MLAEDFLGAISLDQLGSRVPRDDSSLAVQCENGVVAKLLDEHAKPLLARSKSSLAKQAFDRPRRRLASRRRRGRPFCRDQAYAPFGCATRTSPGKATSRSARRVNARSPLAPPRRFSTSIAAQRIQWRARNRPRRQNHHGGVPMTRDKVSRTTARLVRPATTTITPNWCSSTSARRGGSTYGSTATLRPQP